MISSWRVIAQRALTNEFLSWDLDIQVSDLSWSLNGPGSLKATCSPDVGQFRAVDGSLLLDEWSTLLYIEDEYQQIRWGGILVSSTFEGSTWSLEAAGFSTYPHGIPYGGIINEIGIDPATVIESIWANLQQQYPNGNLGVIVRGDKTTVKLGTPATTYMVGKDNKDAKQVEAAPYMLSWWDAKDSGQEIDDLAKNTPLDFVEQHAWLPGDVIEHKIVIGFPRLGTRRTDLVFEGGVNILNTLAFSHSGDDYANEVVAIGAGEGALAIRTTAAVTDGRLRRPYVLSAKEQADANRLATMAQSELNLRKGLLEIPSIDVVDHPHAPIGSWQLGDDILVTAEVPWLGSVDLWCRVTGWNLNSNGTASLQLARSDSFSYGGTS